MDLKIILQQILDDLTNYQLPFWVTPEVLYDNGYIIIPDNLTDNFNQNRLLDFTYLQSFNRRIPITEQNILFIMKMILVGKYIELFESYKNNTVFYDGYDCDGGVDTIIDGKKIDFKGRINNLHFGMIIINSQKKLVKDDVYYTFSQVIYFRGSFYLKTFNSILGSIIKKYGFNHTINDTTLYVVKEKIFTRGNPMIEMPMDLIKNITLDL